MGRKRKAKAYSMVFADSLSFVGEDRVFDPESELENSLLDEIDSSVADEVLIALRKAFSLTYPRNSFIDDVQSALAEIRRIGSEAMKRMPEVLTDLGLTPIPPVMDDPSLNKSTLFKFVFVRNSDIDIAVKFEGKRQRLLNVIGHEDAAPLLTTLRAAISDTFEEAHDEDQHLAILRKIRHRIHSVLPPFNSCLEDIEIEPIVERLEATDEEEDEEMALDSDQ
jgi:hypothetical protein